MRRETPCLLAVTLALVGCTMIPRYERPAIPVPETWPERSRTTREPERSSIRWHEFITDTRLRSVVTIALANNRDLRVAALNVEKVQALFRIQRSEISPSVGGMATGDKYRLPEKMADDGHGKVVETYAINIGTLPWELDLFGRIRSLNERALHQYLATEQARDATQTALIAAVCGAYLSLAADRENLALAEGTARALQESLELIRHSRDLGIASDLDLSQVRSQVEAARVAVGAYRGRVATDRNALDLVVGDHVPDDLLPENLSAVTGAGDLVPGLPSDLLLRRPDILMAEHQLQAANANIGAARAAFFPRITLTAGIGSMSPELDQLLGSGTRTWSFTPQIIAPLFASGSLRANLRATKIDREIAVALYEKAIQTAFREVSDGLTLRLTLTEQRDAQERLVVALEDTLRLSDARYKAGLDGYLGVLVAQRSLFAAQQALVALRLAEAANRITLFKALGGDGGFMTSASVP